MTKGYEKQNENCNVSPLLFNHICQIFCIHLHILKQAKLVFTNELKTFSIEVYFRNWLFENGEWVYNISTCLDDFQQRFPNALFVETNFYRILRNTVQLFRVLTHYFNLGQLYELSDNSHFAFHSLPFWKIWLIARQNFYFLINVN
jgi:hypothetical protein